MPKIILILYFLGSNYRDSICFFVSDVINIIYRKLNFKNWQSYEHKKRVVMKVQIRMSFFVILIIALGAAAVGRFFTNYGMEWYEAITVTPLDSSCLVYESYMGRC